MFRFMYAMTSAENHDQINTAFYGLSQQRLGIYYNASKSPKRSAFPLRRRDGKMWDGFGQEWVCVCV